MENHGGPMHRSCVALGLKYKEGARPATPVPPWTDHRENGHTTRGPQPESSDQMETTSTAYTSEAGDIHFDYDCHDIQNETPMPEESTSKTR